MGTASPAQVRPVDSTGSRNLAWVSSWDMESPPLSQQPGSAPGCLCLGFPKVDVPQRPLQPVLHHSLLRYLQLRSTVFSVGIWEYQGNEKYCNLLFTASQETVREMLVGIFWASRGTLPSSCGHHVGLMLVSL